MAFRVGRPPEVSMETESCYIARKTVTATSTRPIHLLAGYQLDDRSTDDGVKTLVYVQIMCFDDTNTLVFKQSVYGNMWSGVAESGYYPRALFYPPAAGTYDCGIRMANAYMGQPPLPVYALSGYFGVREPATVAGQDGSPHPAVPPPDFSNGENFVHMPLGSTTQLRRVQLTVPEDVETLRASTNVSYTECSWGTHDNGKCPGGEYDSKIGSRSQLRIVAWQTMPGSTKVCQYLAPPDADVGWTVVRSNRHHKGLKVDAELVLTDDPDCSRRVVVKTVMRMGDDPAYDSGFAVSRSTVLSVFGH